MHDPVAQAIEGFTPRTGSPAVARFARQIATCARPESVDRAKAFLYAATCLGVYAESVGADLDHETALREGMIERCAKARRGSPATRRTLRSNLRAIARRLAPEGPVAARLPRERAKVPYSPPEIAAYLALADAQPTESRRQRANALVCLSAGAGLVGCDMKAVRGTDVVCRSGGVVVCVPEGRCARVVPVLSRYHDRLLGAGAFAGERLVIGGTSGSRRNVTTPLTASLAGGADLPRIEIARLRATWLGEVAGAIGLRAFMDAAGIVCSQRLGDLVAGLEAVEEDRAVELLGGSR